MTADMFSGSPLKRIPPRRFAPPLLIRGGEIRTGLSIPNSRRAQYPRVSPPLLRRGAAEGGGVVAFPLLYCGGVARSAGVVSSAQRDEISRIVAPARPRAGFEGGRKRLDLPFAD